MKGKISDCNKYVSCSYTGKLSYSCEYSASNFMTYCWRSLWIAAATVLGFQSWIVLTPSFIWHLAINSVQLDDCLIKKVETCSCWFSKNTYRFLYKVEFKAEIIQLKYIYLISLYFNSHDKELCYRKSLWINAVIPQNVVFFWATLRNGKILKKGAISA